MSEYKPPVLNVRVNYNMELDSLIGFSTAIRIHDLPNYGIFNADELRGLSVIFADLARHVDETEKSALPNSVELLSREIIQYLPNDDHEKL